MSTPDDDLWTARLHAAVDEHPAAHAFDAPAYAAAGRRVQARRRRATAVSMTVAAIAAVVAGVSLVGPRGETPDPAPVGPDAPTPATSPSGWAAVDAYQGGGDIYLVRPGEEARRLEVPGWEDTSEACPAWSPDGTRIVFGRLHGSPDATSADAELVIVPVGADGARGRPTVLQLDGFRPVGGFDAHPCAIWAPDGRWVAFAGAGEVWVLDTQTRTTRRLPNLSPSDLEWRPGTDELAIAGDTGAHRGSPTESTPVTIYSVSTGELRALESTSAAHVTWSPDGETLAYTGGESDEPQLWLVDVDGGDRRLLVPQLGDAIHGIGPVWSPAGDRIAYQRLDGSSAEGHEVVLVHLVDGTERVIEPPQTEGLGWYPFTVAWSPDGETLLYTGWTAAGGGVVAVRADVPHQVTVLIDGIDPVPDYYSHRWTPIQMWGRQSG